VTNFAAVVQGEEGFRHLIGIHQRIRPVDQQQIEMVGRQIAQRLLGAEHDMVAVGNIVADGVFSARFGGNPAFADNFHPATQMRRQLQRFAKGRLALIIAVNIGVIDGGNAQIQVLLNKADQLAWRTYSSPSDASSPSQNAKIPAPAEP
jgi:hypothetical protein